MSDPTMRHPLTGARHLRGWSQEGLATLLRSKGLGTTRKTVTRWEKGVTPDAAAQTAMRELFNVIPDGRVAWPHWLPTGGMACSGEAWDLEGTVQALANVAEGALVDRREFIVLAGAELLLPVYQWRLTQGPWLANQEGGRQVTSALVDEIEALIAMRRRMDDEHGGGALLDALHADLRFIANLLQHGSYREQVGRRLYSAAAEVARLAGWAAFDSGRHAAAQQYYLAALRSTAAIGDRALGVNIVGFMGIQAYSTDRLDDATQLMDVATAESAQKTPEVVQAMAWARSGRAYAKVGNSQAARGALNKATHFLNKAKTGDSPTWAYWVDETRIAAQIGRALFDLGDNTVAERELLAAVESCGDHYPRDRATWLGRVATAQLRQGRIDDGCQSGRQTVDLLADQVESVRGIGFLQVFRHELEAYGPSAVAREFAEYAHLRLDGD